MLSEDSPFIRIGGEQTLHLLVERVYELLDNLPELWELRQCFDQPLSKHRETTYQLLNQALESPLSNSSATLELLPLPKSERQLQQWSFCLQQTLDEFNISHDLQALVIDNLTCCQLPHNAQVA